MIHQCSEIKITEENMKKKGIRFLSTVIAGIVTATSVPWGMTGVFAETANEAETSEIGGSVIAVEDEPLLGGFEEMPSEVTTALQGPVNVTVTTTLTEVVTTAAETTFVTTETSPALTTKPQASARITEDGYKYYITGGFVVIEGYEGESSELVIPSEIDGKPVREIGYSAFSGHEDIKSVQIPESVERIGHNAFSGCKGITSISVPDTVASLGDGAFSDCASLAEVKLPHGLARIEDDTFSDCKELKNISIPESTERLGKRVFSGCESLSAITITENISTIGDMAFYGCTSLDEIIVPDTVSSLGFAVFADCTGLKNAVLPKGITALKSGNGFGMFTGCELLESVTLPEELKSIGYSAFKGCTSLKGISLPETVTSVDHDAFSDCTSLETIIIPAGVTVITDSLLKNCTALATVSIPENVSSIGESSFENCASLSLVTIPDSVVSLGNMAFSGCTSLTEITVPEKVTELGYGAFSGCTSLVKAVLSDGITQLKSEKKNGTFKNCSALADVKLPSGLVYIGEDSFRGCVMLKNIDIPEGLTVLEAGAFAEDEKLGTIQIPDGVVQIGDEAFSGCKSLSKAELPAKLEIIGDKAFSGCSVLSDIGDKAEHFKFYEYTFDGCRMLSDPRATVFEVSETSFDANTLNGTVGGIVNFTMRYNLNDWISEDAGECTFQWNLPDGLLMIESSVLSDDSNTIKIGNNSNIAVAANTSGVIRFTARIQSYNEEGYDIRPKISFKSHEFNWTQKLPDLNVKAPEITIGAPTITGSETVDVYGISKPGQAVTVYVDGEKAADAEANAYTGRYNAKITLPEAVSGNNYEIYAVCGDKSSEKVIITYSLTDPTIDKVEINYCTHAPTDTNPYDAEMDITSTFTEGKRPLVYFYPAGGMNFKIHAENSEQIIAMKITSTKGTEKKSLRAVYNKEKDVWETPVNSFFDPSNRNYVPGSLNVSMIKKTPDIIDYAVGDETVIKNNVLDNEILKNLSITPVEKNDNAAMYEIKGSDGKNYDVDCKVFTYQAPSINLSGKTVKPADIAKNPSAYGFKKSGKTVVQNGVTYDLYTKDSGDVKSTKDDDFIAASMKKLDKANEIYDNVIGGKYVASAVANVVVPKNGSDEDSNPGSVIIQTMVENKVQDDIKTVRNWYVSEFENRKMEPTDHGKFTQIKKSNKAVEVLDKVDKVSQYTGYVVDAYKAYTTHEQRVAAANGSARLNRLADSYFAIDMIVNSGKIASDFIPGGGIYLGPMLSGLSESLDNYYDALNKEFSMLDEIDAEMGWDDEYYDESGSVNMVIDPSGFVYEGSESNRIDGAKMTCYKLNDKTNEWEIWNAEDYDQINPQYTKAGGKYSWDVPEGHYYVTCEMEGYETIQSEGFTVSPPKLDLNFNLISTENPNVSDTVLTDGSIELTFSNYVKIDTVNNDSVHVDGTKNPYEIIPVKDSETDEVAKKFVIKGNFTDTLELTITVDDTVMGYNDLPVGAFSTKIENTGIIPVPAAVTNLVYNGMELTGVPDGSGYTGSGGTARNAGKYTAVLKLNEGLKWLGGSAEDAEIEWSIAEAELSDVSVKQKAPLTYTGSELTAEVETTGQTVDDSKISFEYSTEKDGEYSNKVPAFVQAGEYTVYYKAMAKNHVEVTGTFKVTVKKPVVTTVVTTTTTKATTTTMSKSTTVTTKATTVTTTTAKPTTVTTKATTVTTTTTAKPTTVITKATTVTTTTTSKPTTVTTKATTVTTTTTSKPTTVTAKATTVTTTTTSKPTTVTTKATTVTTTTTSKPTTVTTKATTVTTTTTAKPTTVTTKATTITTTTTAKPTTVTTKATTVSTALSTTTSVSATTVTTTTPSVTTPQVTFVSGDANHDGKLDVRDAVFIVKKLAEEQRRVLPKNADFNGDGKVDVRDAAAIARFLAKKH